MILTEWEPELPAGVEQSKARVLLCLATMHARHEYLAVSDLTGFLDQLQANLDAVDGPAGLRRVILFWRTPAAVDLVRRRMINGGVMFDFRAPQCWMQMGHSLPKLEAWARRIEPGLFKPVGV